MLAIDPELRNCRCEACLLSLSGPVFDLRCLDPYDPVHGRRCVRADQDIERQERSVDYARGGFNG